MSSKFVLSAQLAIQPPSASSIKGVVNSINQQLKGIKQPQVLNGAAIQKQAQQAAKGLNAATRSANSLGSAMGNLKKRFASRIFDAAIFSVVNTAIASVGSAISGAIRSGIAFEKELIKIQQVTGKTRTELNSLVTAIDDTSTAFGTSSAELANVGRTFSQAGLGARDVQVALKAVAATDLAPTFENMTKTAEGAIAIFGQFGTSVDELGDQLGSINALAGAFAVESGDLIEAIKRGGAAFQTAGGSLNEYLALFTAVRSTTREGAPQISTGLRTIFTRIQRPSTIKYFKELGVELTDATGKFIGAMEATRRLSDAFGNLEQGDTQLIEVAQQLGGVRQVSRVIPLLKDFEKAEAALAVAAGGTNSVLKDREIALTSFAAKLSMLKESVLELGRAVLDQGAAFKGLTDVLTAIVQSVTSVVKGFNVLNDIAGKGTTSLISLAAAFGVLSVAFLGFNKPMGLLISSLTFLIPQLTKLFSDETGREKDLASMTKAISGMTAAVVALGVAGKALGGMKWMSLLGGVMTQGAGLTGAFGKAGGLAAKLGGYDETTVGVAEKGSSTYVKDSKKDRLGNAFVGAAGGVAGAKLTEALTGRQRKADQAAAESMETFTKNLESTSIDVVGDAAVRSQAEKDYTKATNIAAGAAGAVASIWLGPVGGAFVGALTGFTLEIIGLIPGLTSAFGQLRDGIHWLLSSFGLGNLVSSNEEIKRNAELTAISNQSIGRTVAATKKFNEELEKVKKTGDGSKPTSDDIAGVVNTELAGLGRNLAAIDQRIDLIKDPEQDNVYSRVKGDYNSDELDALANGKAAKDKAEESAIEAFKEIAAQTINEGGDFDDAFAKLSPELQRVFKESFGTNKFEELFTARNVKREDGTFGDGVGKFKQSIIDKNLGDFNDAIRKTITLQNELGESQRKLLEVQDEAAKIIAEFGGPAYTPAQQEANLLKQANTGQSKATRLDNLSPEELKRRGLEAGNQLSQVRKDLALEDTGGEKGSKTKKLEAQEKELLRIGKQTYDITKKLIDIRKQELSIIETKNEKEKAALKSAITGDFSALFAQQASQGVIASAATGGGVGGFSQTAISDAITELQSQQSAGVTDVFGQNISKVIQNLATQGLANVGINGGSGDVLAGTTSEEQRLQKEIRELATVLPAAAQGEMEAAQTQLEAARMQVSAASKLFTLSGGSLDDDRIVKAENRAIGGSIFRKRGTDSVPAMLTPGEFVVRRSAVQRGNNLNMLRAMNGGGDAKSVGGTVYASGGGLNKSSGSNEMDFSGLNKAANAMVTASNAMKTMVEKLGQIKLSVTLAPTNHNVNITGTSALQAMGEDIQDKILDMVGKKLSKAKASGGGRLDEQQSDSNLPSVFN